MSNFTQNIKFATCGLLYTFLAIIVFLCLFLPFLLLVSGSSAHPSVPKVTVFNIECLSLALASVGIAFHPVWVHLVSVIRQLRTGE